MNILTKSDPKSDPRTYAIIGAAMEVHRQLGCGFLEPVYQEALAMELMIRSIPFRSQHDFPIVYKGRTLESFYRPDFTCFDSVIVELKALGKLGPIEESQIINYLKVTGYQIGLLLNFGSRSLERRRFILSSSENK
ncbi:MAG TPA: GxxExxY protein [Pyrinomonadaceae bacterium]|nr:GxxExxY protein [Pyrinomonadaceae bacterium]